MLIRILFPFLHLYKQGRYLVANFLTSLVMIAVLFLALSQYTIFFSNMVVVYCSLALLALAYAISYCACCERSSRT